MNYYLGPYTIKVHNSVPRLPAADGVNFLYNPRLFKDGKIHKCIIHDGLPDLTEEEYKTEFCYKDQHNDYWYDANKHIFANKYIHISDTGIPYLVSLDDLYTKAKKNKIEKRKLKMELDDAEDCSMPCIIS